MNEPEPRWYAKLKEDPFNRPTFTIQTVETIERRAAEGDKPVSKLARLVKAPAMLLAAGALLLLITLPHPYGRAPLTSPTPGATQNREELIRAAGLHEQGRLVVKPATQAKVAPLGAASCYGQETDLSWHGDYEAVWEPANGAASTVVLTFPADFEIIQRDDTPVKMQKFKIGEIDLFAYVPRYTDCHALETYLFGVSEGQAFAIPFEMEPGRVWTQLGQLPHRPLEVEDGVLTITGGYGAGQDYININHFQYDAAKRTMVLQRTDQAKPNEIEFER